MHRNCTKSLNCIHTLAAYLKRNVSITLFETYCDLPNRQGTTGASHALFDTIIFKSLALTIMWNVVRC